MNHAMQSMVKELGTHINVHTTEVYCIVWLLLLVVSVALSCLLLIKFSRQQRKVKGRIKLKGSNTDMKRKVWFVWFLMVLKDEKGSV